MDSVAIVTGGSRGIGRATALAAAKRGYKVVVGYASNKAAADEVVAKIDSSNGKAVAIKCDVGIETDILDLFKKAAAFGKLGVLVNNAGVVDMTARVDEMSAARLTRMMNINIVGSILCAREAVKRMSTKFGGTGGVIVNISSVAATSDRLHNMSITPPPKARSIPSRSASRAKSALRAFASTRSDPA